MLNGLKLFLLTFNIYTVLKTKGLFLDESKQRKQELDSYRLYAKDEGFYQVFFDMMKRMANVGNL